MSALVAGTAHVPWRGAGAERHPKGGRRGLGRWGLRFREDALQQSVSGTALGNLLSAQAQRSHEASVTALTAVSI